MNQASVKFYQKNGLTPYAMACGYVQRVEHNSVRVDLWSEGACYHVKAYNFKIQERLCWESFDNLTDARNIWQNIVMQEFGPIIKELKKDKRYTVNLEHTGHNGPRWVARFCGEWLDNADTQYAVWVKILAHRKN